MVAQSPCGIRFIACCTANPSVKRTAYGSRLPSTLEVTLKLHGYTDEGLKAEDIAPANLAEVTLVAAPDELRRIARFLEQCASGIEAHGKSWGHEHLSDIDRSFMTSPHLVVFNPERSE